MKKLIFAVLFLNASNCSAQTKDGTIIYEMKLDLYRRIPEENTQMRAMVPHYKTGSFILEYTANECVFKLNEEEPDIADQENTGGNRVIIKTGGSPDDISYKNFSDQKSIERREFMGVDYLISGQIKKIDWKLENETRSILGYTCKKATTKNQNGNKVTAWYAEEIPVPAGPQQYSGLPGMILVLDSNEGESVYTAKTISSKINQKDIVAPVKGKKISTVDFDLIQKAEMAKNGGMKIITK